jgi:hypothetical protein
MHFSLEDFNVSDKQNNQPSFIDTLFMSISNFILYYNIDMKIHINMCIFMFMLPFLQLMFGTFFSDIFLFKKLRFDTFKFKFPKFR